MSLLVCVCLLASVALVTANGPTCVGGTCVQKLEMMHRPAQVYVCGDATLTDTSIGGGLIVKGDANLIDVDVSAEIGEFYTTRAHMYTETYTHETCFPAHLPLHLHLRLSSNTHIIAHVTLSITLSITLSTHTDEDLTGLRYDLIVGGDLSISCAHVAGNIKHGGAYDATAVTIKSIHSTSHGSIIDFNMASMAWMAYSATLSTVTSSTSTSMSGNQLLVTGSGATATYAGVTVSGSSGFSAVCFSSVDAGDGIIINIQVDSAGFAFGATEECSSGSKGDASKVIYNFHGTFVNTCIRTHARTHTGNLDPVWIIFYSRVCAPAI